ncbi:MAG TPA: hypothetical protein VI383_06080, partial [Gemmatimonadales bacterium]|nr:hypothetical protein [Gemmatimonadales bacterium]
GIRDPAPSPDGRRVAFTALDRLYVADLPGGTPRRLTTVDAGEYFPTWSPDGSAIAYVSWDERDGHIMRVSAAGGAPPGSPGSRPTTARSYGPRTGGGSWRSDPRPGM